MTVRRGGPGFEVKVMASWVVVWLLLVVPTWLPAHESVPSRTRVLVHGCYDGDTCTVTIPSWPPVVGEKIPVRILGIDAPERKGKCAAEIALATEARRFLEGRLRARYPDSAEPLRLRPVRVELSEMRRDKYFRILARVWADGQEVGPLLIQAGLARSYAGGPRHGWCSP